MFLLDTNIIIHGRDGHDGVLRKFIEHDGKLFMSALTLVELQRGLFKYPGQTDLRHSRLLALLPGIPVISFDKAAAEAYGQIIARRGWVRGRDTDRMVAAHAIQLNAVLVTNNIADFVDIPGLSLEDWAST